MDECELIRPGAHTSYGGKQGLSYFEGISAQSAGARSSCMLTIPPGGWAKAHLHENHESAV